MNFIVYLGIGILLVLAIIGLVILLRQNSLKSNNKKICIVIGILQMIHAGLYLSGMLDKIAQINTYTAFGICVALSLICIVMATWMLLPSSKFNHGIKYLMMFIAILQLISTIVIFLMPD